jgi:hypothetical protein
MRKQLVASVAFFALLQAWLPPVQGEVPSPDVIFTRAKDAWRARVDPPFVTYGLRERYDWRGRTHDNWWQSAYRSRDRVVSLRRIIVPEDEDARLRGTPININIHFHQKPAHADAFDTNPDADAFPILDPQIEPNTSFGMLRSEPKSALVGASPVPRDLPVTRATPTPATQVTAPTPQPGETPLRELIRVEAVARDYRIELAGTERIRDTDTYHLMLTPLRDPHVYRLRDLWVDTQTYVTVQLALDGLFEGEPYADARWIVSYVPIGGRYYVAQIKAADQLRFGMDRYVSDLEFDFVQYEFPATLPPMTFERYL